MLIGGTYTMSNGTFFFQATANKQNQRWSLFTEHTREDMTRIAQGLPPQSPPIISRDVCSFDAAGNKPKHPTVNYLAASMIVSHSGKLIAYYGNTIPLEQLFSGLRTVDALQTVLRLLEITSAFPAVLPFPDDDSNPSGEELTLDRALMSNPTPAELNQLRISAYTQPQLPLELALPDGARIEIERKLGFVKHTGPYGKLGYYNAASYDNSQLSDTVQKARLLSWSELKLVKKDGLSWLYDAYGNEIKDYQIVNTREGILQVAQILRDPKLQLVTIDTETTGLNVFYLGDVPHCRSQICGMSLTWKEDQGIYIPFKSNKFAVVDIKETLDLLMPILRTKALGAHNGPFDMRVFRSIGYEIRIAIDTLNMEFIEDSTVSRGSKGLKLTTRKYFGHETLELDDVLGSDKNAELLPDVEWDVIRIYGCADTDYVFKLIIRNFNRVATRTGEVFNLDMGLTYILSVAEYYGQHVDQDLLKKLSDVNQKDYLRLTVLCKMYLRDIGAKTIARKLWTQSLSETNSDAEVTEDMIQELLDSPEFQEELPRFFLKTKKQIPLELPSPMDVRVMLYDILNYPIFKYDKDSGLPTADSEALERLMSYKGEAPIKFLAGDIPSALRDTDIAHSPEEAILISKKKFDGMQYPFAYLLSEWRKVHKLRTSFFDVLLSKEQGEYYYTTNSMTSAETARVINPLQTLIGVLKKLIIPYTDDYYFIVFDMAQIEFRTMLGLAVSYWQDIIQSREWPEEELLMLLRRDIKFLCDRLDDPEKDYHREGGAIFAGCTPEDMSSGVRKKIKAIHFSVPFGAGPYSIAKGDILQARTRVQVEEAIEDSSARLAAWQKNLYPLFYYLERKRDEALTPVPESELPVGRTGKWGRVKNALGRFRWFDLNGIDYKQMMAIRRQAGNYPIQSYARETFFTGLRCLFTRLEREKLFVPTDAIPKVFLSAFIHDECVVQVHKSVSPYRMYKLIYEECLITLKNHPKYFMGIAVVNNWYEGKADKYEAPVRYVEQMVKEYTANPEKFDAVDHWQVSPRDYVYSGIQEYMRGRYIQELTPCIREDSTGVHVDLDTFIPKFNNYFLKPRLQDHFTPHRPIVFKETEEQAAGDFSVVRIEDILMRTYDRPIYITYAQQTYCLSEMWAQHQDWYTKQTETKSTTEAPTTAPVDSDAEKTSVFSDIGEDFYESDSRYAGDSYAFEEEKNPPSIQALDEAYGLPDDIDSWFGTEEGAEDWALSDFALSDSAEDALEMEQSYAKEALLVAEFGRSKLIDTEVHFVEEEDRVYERLSTYMVEMGMDQVMIRLPDAFPAEGFQKIQDYLREHLDPVGRLVNFNYANQNYTPGYRVDYLVNRQEIDALVRAGL